MKTPTSEGGLNGDPSCRSASLVILELQQNLNVNFFPDEAQNDEINKLH